MTMRQRPWSQFSEAVAIAWIAFVVACATAYVDARAGDPDSATQAAREHFFEQNVRPLLAEKCYSCHGDKKQKGGLRLDSLEAILKGGESGPAVVAGKPDESLIVEAINFLGPEMPPNGKLSPAKVAVLTQWVSTGGSLASGRPRSACPEFAVQLRRHKNLPPRPVALVASTGSQGGHSATWIRRLGRLVAKPYRRVHSQSTSRTQPHSCC